MATAAAAAALAATTTASAVASGAGAASTVVGSFIGGAVAGAASRLVGGVMSTIGSAISGEAATTAPTRGERAYDAASSIGTFFFGEAKTDVERIRESQCDLQHDARHFDRDRQIAEKAAAASSRTVQAMISRGETGPQLKNALRQRQFHNKKAARASAVSNRLETSAQAVGDTEAKLRILGAASAQADALVRTNTLLEAQGSPMELANTITRETTRANAQLKSIEAAMAATEEDPDDEDNAQLEAAYAEAVAAALQVASFPIVESAKLNPQSTAHVHPTKPAAAAAANLQEESGEEDLYARFDRLSAKVGKS